MIEKPQKLPEPTARWVDQNGRPTKEFFQYLRDIDGKVRELIDVSNDHETRITVLEP